jgi:hypothetical protein
VSCFFEVDEETVWNPSTASGRLFVGCARAMEEFCGADSGVSDIVDDESTVDADVFREFYGRLATLVGGTKNVVVHALTGEFLVMCAVLLERAGVDTAAPAGAEPSEWRARLDAMSGGMPT